MRIHRIEFGTGILTIKNKLKTDKTTSELKPKNF
jgi:hypothetical protein